MRERINDNTVICIWFRMHYAIDTGVGIVSVYFLSGFVRTSFRINESAPHFLCIMANLSLLPGKNQMAIGYEKNCCSSGCVIDYSSYSIVWRKTLFICKKV